MVMVTLRSGNGMTSGDANQDILGIKINYLSVVMTKMVKYVCTVN